MTKDNEHPFFRPLWRRIVVILVCVGWTALEFATNAQFWGMIALGFTAYAIWAFLLAYNPPEEKKE